jgi:hypothetical protein
MPFCGILAMGNYPTRLTAKQAKDTGVIRRLNVLRLTGVYNKDKERDVKAEIETGVFNHELFWLFRVIVTRYLQKLPLDCDRIHPRPPDVVAETDAVFNTDKQDQIKDWVEEFTVPAASYKAASSIVDLKTAIAKVIDYDYQPQKNDSEFTEMLKTAGVEPLRTGTERVLTYMYPDMQRRKAMKLLVELGRDAKASE